MAKKNRMDLNLNFKSIPPEKTCGSALYWTPGLKDLPDMETGGLERTG